MATITAAAIAATAPTSTTAPAARRRRIRRAVSGASSAFDGTLTPEICALIRERRRGLGASLQQLAGLLGVNVSTLRKWEGGHITSCHAVNACRIAEFLNGMHDRRLRTLNLEARGLMHLWTSLPEGVSARLERAMTIYRICAGHPDLQGDLMCGLDGAMGDTLRRLLERSWPAGTAGLGAGLLQREE